MTTEASDGERRLYRDLFYKAGYNKEIRPRHDPHYTVVVDVEFDLNHLIKLVRNILIDSVCYTVHGFIDVYCITL